MPWKGKDIREGEEANLSGVSIVLTFSLTLGVVV